jgi:SAM-dependent methyltransferase
MQHRKRPDENTYVLDVESAAETARLTGQPGLITRAMGGLCPEIIDFSGIKHVLDIACGPGGWALDVALAHPEVKVIGIDLSDTMVRYAGAFARVQGLDDARFSTMDVLQPLDFLDRAFDLVNARFLAAVLPAEAWREVVGEYVRALRPGGLLCLTGAEVPLTNSSACERLTELCLRAMRLAGYLIAPDGRNLSIAQQLGSFLRRAGCQQIQHRAYFLDYSQGAEEYWSMFHNLEVCMS